MEIEEKENATAFVDQRADYCRADSVESCCGGLFGYCWKHLFDGTEHDRNNRKTAVV